MTPEALAFPRVEGSSLARTHHRLPGSLQGELNLLLIAFHQRHQRDVDSWLPPATELQRRYPDLRTYEIPVIGRGYRWMAGFIDGGMRAAISDHGVREATITLYVDKDRFRRSLDIAGERDIVPMLVDGDGRILWRTTGRFRASVGEQLAEIVEAQLGGTC